MLTENAPRVRPPVPELPPGYEVVESEDDDAYTWSIKLEDDWLDMDYVCDENPPDSREEAVALCWSHWAVYHASEEWVAFMDHARGVPCRPAIGLEASP